MGLESTKSLMTFVQVAVWQVNGCSRNLCTPQFLSVSGLADSKIPGKNISISNEKDLPEKKMDVSTSHVPLLVLSRWSYGTIGMVGQRPTDQVRIWSVEARKCMECDWFFLDSPHHYNMFSSGHAMFRLEGWFPETMEMWFDLTDQMTVIGVTWTKENHTISSFPSEQTRISSLGEAFEETGRLSWNILLLNSSPCCVERMEPRMRNIPMTEGAIKPTLK